MDRAAFVHVLQAAAAVVAEELVVVGSRAVLAHVEEPPEEMVRSMEVDLYPRQDPDRAIEIDRTHGEGRLVRFEVPPVRAGTEPPSLTACRWMT